MFVMLYFHDNRLVVRHCRHLRSVVNKDALFCYILSVFFSYSAFPPKFALATPWKQAPVSSAVCRVVWIHGALFFQRSDWPTLL